MWLIHSLNHSYLVQQPILPLYLSLLTSQTIYVKRRGYMQSSSSFLINTTEFQPMASAS